jgi:hypothetical protein
MPEKTQRHEGAWIGQRPDENTDDENTDKVRQGLDDGAERVAVTNNESGPPETATESDEGDEAR